MNQNKLSYDLFDKLLLTKFPQKKNVVDKDSHQTRNKSDNKKKKKERNWCWKQQTYLISKKDRQWAMIWLPQCEPRHIIDFNLGGLDYGSQFNPTEQSPLDPNKFWMGGSWHVCWCNPFRSVKISCNPPFDAPSSINWNFDLCQTSKGTTRTNQLWILPRHNHHGYCKDKITMDLCQNDSIFHQFRSHTSFSKPFYLSSPSQEIEEQVMEQLSFLYKVT